MSEVRNMRSFLLSKISERNDLELVLNTLRQPNGKPFDKNALLHSDQGFQYTTKSYENKLKELKIQGSHSRRGNYHDNACIECFFSHLKTEKVIFGSPQNNRTGGIRLLKSIFIFTITVVFKKN
jgi:transposase InsO family protein